MEAALSGLARTSARLGFAVLGLAAVLNVGALAMAERSYDALRRTSTAVLDNQRATVAARMKAV